MGGCHRHLQSPFFSTVFASALRGVADGNRDAALAALEQIDFDLIELDPEFLYYVSIWFVPAGAVERGLTLIGKAVQRGFFCWFLTQMYARFRPRQVGHRSGKTLRMCPCRYAAVQSSVAQPTAACAGPALGGGACSAAA